MRHMLQAEEVLIGIEDNKPQAVAAVQAAIAASGQTGIEAVAIPTRYPAGGAKQLIRVLTGIEVPHGRRSTDFGVQCFNVGTAYSIYEALELGRPLISRLVTVAGNVDAPRNYEVLIGTPMDHVVRLAGPRADTDRYIMGGPMMGVRMPAFDVPVVKATNCILVGSEALFPTPAPEMPCIRCGECAKACPADLAPFELYWFSRSKNFGKAQEYHLFDCIECGCCSFVCPSHIPLVDYYRFSKSEIWARERDKEAADAARDRFEFKNHRQEREKLEKAEKLAAKAAATREKVATDGTAPAAADSDAAASKPAPDAAKRALIEAAMEKARLQKAQTAPRNTDQLSPDVAAEIADIEARREVVTKPVDTPPRDA
jgi:electron transport complex protein RnfC